MGRVVRPKFLAKTTTAERKAQRKNVILADAAITERTQERYYVALRRLLLTVEKTKHLSHLDDNISDWLERQWERGQTLSFVSDALCGLHHFEPSTKKCIPNTWKLFRTWRKLEAPNRAPPLTLDLVYVLAHHALHHDDLIFAALLLLGFFALLRTGEILNACPEHFILGADEGVLSLPITKTGVRHGAGETIAFDDSFALDAIREAIKLREFQGLTRVPIWQASPQAFRNRFTFYCRKFDLLHHCFRPYSLRRGGATWTFQSTGSMERALLKGRWNSAQVAKVYIQDGLSKIPSMTFSSKTKEMIRRWHPYQHKCRV